MSNYPAFMICENPMADQQEGHGYREFVLHTGSPMILCKAEWHDIADEVNTSGYLIQRADLQVSLEAVRIEQANDVSANDVAKITREMGEWYIRYCEWEDENH